MGKKNRSKSEEKLDEFAGQVAETLGSVTGDKTMEAEGRADQRKAGRKTYRVEARPNGEWSVTADGASRASGVYKVKDEAVRNAELLANSQKPSQVLVYKRDGTVQTEQTFG